MSGNVRNKLGSRSRVSETEPSDPEQLRSRSRSKTSKTRRRARTAGRLVVAAAVLAGPLTLPPLMEQAAAGTHEVNIQGLQFLPPEMSASVGDEIVWTSRDPDTHGVSGGPMNSPDLHQNDTFRFTVSQPGDITYGCRFHPAMHGVIKVAGGGGGGGGSAPPPAPSGPAPAPAPAPPAPGGVPDIGALLAQLLAGLLGGVPHSVPGTVTPPVTPAAAPGLPAVAMTAPGKDVTVPDAVPAPAQADLLPKPGLPKLDSLPMLPAPDASPGLPGLGSLLDLGSPAGLPLLGGLG